MKTCPNCGKEIDDTSVHCEHCGAEVMSSCCCCGHTLKTDQAHCSECGLRTLKNEELLFSNSAYCTKGFKGINECILKLTNFRILIMPSNRSVGNKCFSIDIMDTISIAYSGSISYANKGKYMVKLRTNKPRHLYKIVLDDGKTFTKLAKKQMKGIRRGSGNSPIVRADGRAGKNQSENQGSDSTKMTLGLGVLCFIIPILGIVIWYNSREKYPKKAKAALLLTIYPTLMLFIMPSLGDSQVSSSSSSNLAEVSSTETVEEVLSDEEIIAEALQHQDIHSLSVINSVISVHFNVSDNLSEELVVGGAKSDIMFILKDILETNVEFTRVDITGRCELGDRYGNSRMDDVIEVRYSKETLDRINWSRFNHHENMYSVADYSNIHPMFQ